MRRSLVVLLALTACGAPPPAAPRTGPVPVAAAIPVKTNIPVPIIAPIPRKARSHFDRQRFSPLAVSSSELICLERKIGRAIRWFSINELMVQDAG